MDSRYLWSARKCPVRRAGVYFGLAPQASHFAVALGLVPNRGSVYDGGRVKVRAEEAWPLIYYAVRDPSAVGVRPVREQARPGELEPVHLIFSVERAAGAAPDTALAGVPDVLSFRDSATPHPNVAFVLTIGIPRDREQRFHERAVLQRGELSFDAVCDALQAATEDVLRA